MALFTISRTVQTGGVVVDAWRRNYPQLELLFEVQGFEEFMKVIASNLLRDNKFGMIFRVSVGAGLSTIDALTDIYTIKTYYQSAELTDQAHALLAMMTINILFQLL